MTAGDHRPSDNEYWVDAWSAVLFSGDLFAAIPFGDQPTLIAQSSEEGASKHFVGEVSFGFGLLITPTCDMYEQHSGDGQPAAHPYRVLVPVLPLAAVAEAVNAVHANLKLLRSRDTIVPYMYLPPLPGHLEEESVACLFRPTLVSDEFLREPPRRVAQMSPEGRRQLKTKLARYWGRVIVERNELPLREKMEGQVRSSATPPSPYDR